MKKRLLTFVTGVICFLFSPGFSNGLFAQYISTSDALARPSNQIVIVSGTTFEDNNASYEYTYDARGWTTNSTSIYPVKVGNNNPGTRQVWVGGEVIGQFSTDLTWREMKANYDGAGILMRSIDYLVIDGIRTHNVMDAIRPRRNSSRFRLSNAYATYTRDDAIENDEMMGGLIEDCLFDGCYVFLSQQGSMTWSTSDSLKITNTLVRLEPMPYDTDMNGRAPSYESTYGKNANRHGQLFKHHDSNDAPLVVDNCIFYVPQHSVNGDASMDFPIFAGCRYTNNILLWTGGGSYPGSLPATGVTEYNLTNSTQAQIDQIWEDAVNAWFSSQGGATIPNAPSSLSAAAVSGSQIDLSWTDNSTNEDGFKIERKTGAGTYSEIDQVGINVTSYSDTGLSASTTYTYRVRAHNTAGNSSYSNEASETTLSTGLPSPWVNQDVGAVGAAGNASYANDVFTVVGSGADIWGTADEFQYVYQQVSGDVEIIARVTSQENTHDYAKAGVMIRENLTAGSKNAKMVITPTQGFKFQWRATADGTSSNTNGTATNTPPNNWVRVVRSGSSFTAYQSSNGTSWTQVGTTQSISMTSSVYVGLAVSSVNDGVLCTATFDNVQVTGGATIPNAPSSLSAAAVSGSQVNLSWTDNSTNEDGFKIERKTGAGSYSEIDQVGINVTSYSDTGLSASTTYTYRVRAYNTAGNSSYSNEASETTLSAGLPSPWVNQDVGAVGAAGSASYLNGVFTVVGSGADIWGTADEFQYVYHQISGDVEIIARVASQENTNNYAKAGVMIREDLTAGSKNAKMVITPTQGFKFQWRSTTGGTSSNTNGTATNTPPNNWVRVVRSGSSFTAYQSSNGISWTQVGTTQSISMTSSVYVGLAVSSVNDGVLCTSTFDNVQVTGGATIPNAPSSLSAAAVSSSQVNLSWTDNSTNEDGFKIERKTGAGSYSEIDQVGANVTSYSDTGLSASTTYTYRVRAYNTAGNSSYSNEASDTTLATIPNAPSSLSAAAVSDSQIDLSWTDNASDEQGFKIERKTGAGSYSEIDQVGINVTSYSDTGLSASTTYTYRVRAYNTAGNSSYSNEASETTQTAALFYDDFEDGNDNGWTQETGSWSVVTDDGSKRYQQGTYSTSQYRTHAGNTSWDDYSFEVDVKPLSFDGNSAIFIFFRYTDYGNTYRAVIHGYNELRLQKSVGGSVTHITDKAYTFNTGTIYTIKIEAVGSDLKIYVNDNLELSVSDASHSSGKIAMSTWKTTANFDNVLVTGGATVPNAPSSLSAAAVSSSQVNLSWTDNSTNEDGFKIERKTGAGSYSEIDQVGANVTSYSDTGLSASTTYTYRVRAYNTAGNSSYSNEASETTQTAALFYDDFEDGNDNGWTQETGSWSVVTDDGSKRYQQGTYSTSQYRTHAGNTSWDDYSFEVDVKPLSFDGNSAIFIFFRYTDYGNTYRAVIHGYNELRLQKSVGGSVTHITDKAYTFNTGTIYTIKIEAVGSDLKIYVNDNLELSVSDASHSSGKIAMSTWKTTANFDNVLVESIELKAATFQQATKVDTKMETGYTLSCYPNPFNQTTSIKFGIPPSGEGKLVELKVYDNLGRLVSTLVKNNLPGGLHEIEFNASDLSGGMYFFRLQCGDKVLTRRALLMK
jgi:uncharacterized protein